MPVLSIDTTGPLVHAVHTALVVVGVGGTVAILLPPLLDRVAGTRPPADEHDLRVQALREALHAGTLGGGSTTATLAPPALPVAEGPTGSRTALPVAVVTSTAAAGVHAAAGAAHLPAQPATAWFLLLCAFAQLVWAVALLTRGRAALLPAALVGNAALVLLWAASRGPGLPGLGREPVGPWDLAAVTFEVLCVAAVLAHGQRAATGKPGTAAGPGTARVAEWAAWSPLARAVAVAALGAVAALALTGVLR